MLDELVNKLQSGVVKFSYAKADGTERIAFGTTSRDLVPIQYSGPQIQELVEASTNAVNSGTTDDKGIMDAALNMLMDSLKPFEPKPKREASANAAASEYINYYDFEAKSFRKFHPEKLIKIF